MFCPNEHRKERWFWWVIKYLQVFNNQNLNTVLYTGLVPYKANGMSKCPSDIFDVTFLMIGKSDYEINQFFEKWDWTKAKEDFSFETRPWKMDIKDLKRGCG